VKCSSTRLPSASRSATTSLNIPPDPGRHRTIRHAT
jgi:hypothetical protein